MSMSSAVCTLKDMSLFTCMWCTCARDWCTRSAVFAHSFTSAQMHGPRVLTRARASAHASPEMRVLHNYPACSTRPPRVQDALGDALCNGGGGIGMVVWVWVWVWDWMALG